MVEKNESNKKKSFKFKLDKSINQNQQEYKNVQQINEKLQFYNFCPNNSKRMLFKKQDSKK